MKRSRTTTVTTSATKNSNETDYRRQQQDLQQTNIKKVILSDESYKKQLTSIIQNEYYPIVPLLEKQLLHLEQEVEQQLLQQKQHTDHDTITTKASEVLTKNYLVNKKKQQISNNNSSSVLHNFHSTITSESIQRLQQLQQQNYSNNYVRKLQSRTGTITEITKNKKSFPLVELENTLFFNPPSSIINTTTVTTKSNNNNDCEMMPPPPSRPITSQTSEKLSSSRLRKKSATKHSSSLSSVSSTISLLSSSSSKLPLTLSKKYSARSIRQRKDKSMIVQSATRFPNNMLLSSQASSLPNLQELQQESTASLLFPFNKSNDNITNNDNTFLQNHLEGDDDDDHSDDDNDTKTTTSSVANNTVGTDLDSIPLPLHVERVQGQVRKLQKLYKKQQNQQQLVQLNNNNNNNNNNYNTTTSTITTNDITNRDGTGAPRTFSSIPSYQLPDVPIREILAYNKTNKNKVTTILSLPYTTSSIIVNKNSKCFANSRTSTSTGKQKQSKTMKGNSTMRNNNKRRLDDRLSPAAQKLWLQLQKP